MQHKEQCIKLVADFLNIELTPELLATTVVQSDHKTMSLTPEKYDDHPFKQRRNTSLGRSPLAGICGVENSVGTVRFVCVVISVTDHCMYEPK